MDMPPPKEVPALITEAEKSLGIVSLGSAMDGRPIAYYANGTFSFRADIEESRSR
jgi:hypothetical protein